MKIIDQKLRDSPTNDKITELWNQADSLRTQAHKQNNEEWFHLMNELCIWIGKQYEYDDFEREIDDEDLGPAKL